MRYWISSRSRPTRRIHYVDRAKAMEDAKKLSIRTGTYAWMWDELHDVLCWNSKVGLVRDEYGRPATE